MHNFFSGGTCGSFFFSPPPPSLLFLYPPLMEGKIVRLGRQAHTPDDDITSNYDVTLARTYNHALKRSIPQEPNYIKKKKRTVNCVHVICFHTLSQ